MKRYLICLEALLNVLLVVSCSGNSSMKGDADSDTTYMSVAEVGELLRDGQPADVYMPAHERLVEMMREGRAKDSPVDILSQSGYFYMRLGEYLKAMEYLHEASDSMAAVRDNISLRGLITLPGNHHCVFLEENAPI